MKKKILSQKEKLLQVFQLIHRYLENSLSDLYQFRLLFVLLF